MGLAFSLLPMKCAYCFQQISLQLDAFSWFVYTGGTCTSVGAYLARNIVQTEYTNTCTLICGLMSDVCRPDVGKVHEYINYSGTMDTIGNQHSVPYSEVSLTRGLSVYFQ